MDKDYLFNIYVKEFYKNNIEYIVEYSSTVRGDQKEIISGKIKNRKKLLKEISKKIDSAKRINKDDSIISEIEKKITKEHNNWYNKRFAYQRTLDSFEFKTLVDYLEKNIDWD